MIDMKKYENYVLISLFSFFFIVSLLTFKDYGVGIEENFHRASGFYWLNYLLNFTELEKLKDLTNYKISELYILNPNLPSVEKNLSYGIVFDVPAALLEIIFDFEENQHNIYLKHYLNFILFFLSAICFSLLLKKKFLNPYVTIFGTLIYFLTPRIYGSSYFDGKDLFYLSMFTFVFYFYYNYENKKGVLNLIFFSLFAAFLTSSRIIGIMIPISFILVYFFVILSSGKIKNNLNIIFIFLFSYLILLYMHWPYLWNVDFKSVFAYQDISVFFNGEFYRQKYLPLEYIPKWILISTPIFILIFFIFGTFQIFKRLFVRLISVKENQKIKYQSDLWKSKNEKIDFFIMLCFLQTIFLYLTFNLQIYSAWRHFFFVHFFISYFFSYGIYYLFTNFRKSKIKLYSFSILLIFFTFEMGYKLYLYHPYQNTYFNNLMSPDDKLKFQRDTAYLSRVDTLKNILDDSKNSKIIKIATASWAPLGDVLYMFSEEEIKKINLIGNDSKLEADYIYTNYIYDVDIRYNKKYEIPEDFYLFKSIIKDDTLIYSIYKKK